MGIRVWLLNDAFEEMSDEEEHKPCLKQAFKNNIKLLITD